MRLGSQERKRVRDKRGVSDGEVQRMKQRLLKMVRRRRLSEGEEGPQRRKRSVREGGKGKTTERKNTEKVKERRRKRNKAVVISTKRNRPTELCPRFFATKGLQACTLYVRAGGGQKRCGNNDTSRRESL